MPAKTPARQVALLVALLVAIAAILAYQFRGPRVAAPAGQRVAVKADPSRAAAARDHAESAPDIRLAALERMGSPIAPNGRNLFRERPKAPPPPPRVMPAAAAVAPDPNAPPPPPPPITLRLVGIVQGSGTPVAALTDGKDVFYGREGDVIEGRYRIVKINVESIDISYLDGRGQRRLSLSG